MIQHYIHDGPAESQDPMKFIVSADDYGISKEITDQILESFDGGALSSVSILANGQAFDHAMDEYKKRPDLRLSIHLNLSEGASLLSSKEIPLLVNKNNEFCHSFLSLWFKYLLSNAQDRQLLRLQVQQELRAQINKVREIVPHAAINVDGHRHIHLVPFVFDALLGLRHEFGLSYIRLLREPAILGNDWKRSVQGYGGINCIKHILLNILTARARVALAKTKVRSCDYFIGVLFTGHMSEYVVQTALRRIASIDKDVLVEILFHPFRAGETEEGIWKDRRDLMHYYRSPGRQVERQALKSTSLRMLLDREGSYEQ